MIAWFIKGGPVMYPIALCSIIALAIIMERFYHLYRARINTDEFLKKITLLLKKGSIKEAIEVCENTPGPVAHILKAGILKHDKTKQEIKETIEEAGSQETPRMEKNLGILATIAHISPLLGLLGTVTGMVRCFRTIEIQSIAGSPVNPGMLAAGIWEALTTTVAGLVVAIPTLVTYNYLVALVDRMVLDMERSSVELIRVVEEKEANL